MTTIDHPVHKMTVDQIEEYLDLSTGGFYGACDVSSLANAVLAHRELEVRKRAALDLYNVLVECIDHIDGNLKRRALDAIALMERPFTDAITARIFREFERDG
jgi:hypothetical protein